ncbi:MAG: hypothetical protein Q7V19_02140 [Bacteroidales bacterium]|nr:hypothetical protein [Bacteroidales bacterium]MDP2237349.1 hypothetical protein [Bacteroidales bacterium]
MKAFFIFFTFIFLQSALFSKPDSLRLFSFNDIFPHSEFEANKFKMLASDAAVDYFKMAMATDANMAQELAENEHSRFYGFLEEVRKNKRYASKPRQQVKFVFKAIHDQYFKLYDPSAPLFSEIFSSGRFNCLTASMLYALAFDHLEIPYEIIQQPQHVYLLAYPTQGAIVVETTNPLKGATLLIDSRSKSRAVQDLINSKLVSAEEVNIKGIDRVYTEYYLSTDTPSLHQLIGSLYFNISSNFGDRMLFADSYEALKKSVVFFPKRLVYGLMIVNGATYLSMETNDFPTICRITTDFERFNIFTVSNRMLIEQGQINLTNALQQEGIKKYDEAFKCLESGFTNPNILQEISYFYYYNRGIENYRKMKLKDALTDFDHSIPHAKDDNTPGMLMLEIIRKEIASNISPPRVYDYLLNCKQDFVHLNDIQEFRNMLQYSAIDMVKYHIERSNFAKADEMRKLFDSQFNPEEVTDHYVLNYLDAAYSTAALLFYRNNQKVRAKAIIDSGLKYVPDSYDLQTKKKALR